MAKRLPLSVWLLIAVIPLLLGRVRRRLIGLGSPFGASKLRVAINFCPKGNKFMLKGDCMLAIGRGKMGKCVLALR
jgi:hypothetical protein